MFSVLTGATSTNFKEQEKTMEGINFQKGK
jgi:hypothetical protein